MDIAQALLCLVTFNSPEKVSPADKPKPCIAATFEKNRIEPVSIAKIFDGNRIKINDGLESGAGRRRSHFCL